MEFDNLIAKNSKKCSILCRLRIMEAFPIEIGFLMFCGTEVDDGPRLGVRRRGLSLAAINGLAATCNLCIRKMALAASASPLSTAGKVRHN
jgi:hypothetical protein